MKLANLTILLIMHSHFVVNFNTLADHWNFANIKIPSPIKLKISAI